VVPVRSDPPDPSTRATRTSSRRGHLHSRPVAVGATAAHLAGYTGLGSVPEAEQRWPQPDRFPATCAGPADRALWRCPWSPLYHVWFSSNHVPDNQGPTQVSGAPHPRALVQWRAGGRANRAVSARCSLRCSRRCGSPGQSGMVLVPGHDVASPVALLPIAGVVSDPEGAATSGTNVLERAVMPP
jgi:hypothetical protein